MLVLVRMSDDQDHDHSFFCWRSNKDEKFCIRTVEFADQLTEEDDKKIAMKKTTRNIIWNSIEQRMEATIAQCCCFC